MNRKIVVTASAPAIGAVLAIAPALSPAAALADDAPAAPSAPDAPSAPSVRDDAAVEQREELTAPTLAGPAEDSQDGTAGPGQIEADASAHVSVH